jgi:hypothetical protein
MAIYQRGKVWHYRFQINGSRYRGCCNTEVKSDALEYEANATGRCLAQPQAWLFCAAHVARDA